MNGESPASIQRDVHKSQPTHVWIHSPSETPPHKMEVSYRLPEERGHPSFTDLMEVQRQAGLAQVHRQLDIPHSQVFVLDRIELGFATSSPYVQYPSEGRVAAFVRAEERAARKPRAAQQEFEFTDGEAVFARGSSIARFLSPEIYRRLRVMGSNLDTYAGFGYSNSTMQFPVMPNRNDPALYDHESDHITAMAVVRSIEDTVWGLSERRPLLRRLALAFESYLEPDQTPILSLTPKMDGTFLALVDQGGVPRARGTVELFLESGGGQ